MKITTCFFSATYTTRKVVERFVGNFSEEKKFLILRMTIRRL
jgi:hypothetical protein